MKPDEVEIGRWARVLNDPVIGHGFYEYMFGNGGWAGESFDAPGRIANPARAMRAGFASASTDTGHSAAVEPAASFARRNHHAPADGNRPLKASANLGIELFDYDRSIARANWIFSRRSGQGGMIVP